MLLRAAALRFLWAAALAGPGVAAAQPDEATEEAALDARAWRIYREANTALAEGRRDEAREAFRRLGVEHPGHPAADAAAQALAAVESAPAAVPPPAASVAPGPLDETEAEETAPEPPSTRRARRSGRTALVTFQTFAGGWGGFLVGNYIRDALAAQILGAAFGAGTGLTLSLLFSGDAEPGQSLAVNVGTFWGILFGSLVAGILDTLPDPTMEDGATDGLAEASVAVPIMVGQLVGTAAGALGATLLRPSAGDVVFANSLGVWALALYGAAFFAKDEVEPATNSEWQRPWIAGWIDVSGVALLSGILLSRFLPAGFSAGRAQLVNLSGAVGLGVGGGAYSIWKAAPGDFVAASALLPIAGAMAGLGIGWYLTRHFDREAESRVSLVPAPAGAGPGLLVQLR